MALRVKIIATDKLSGTLLRVGKSVMRLGVRFAKMGVLAAGAIAAIAIKLQSDLDIGLREIGTLMGGLTDKQIKGMTRELETLAQKWGQSMDILTKTKYDIISAGFDTAAESALLLEKTAILATAGVTDMATAGDLLTTALNAYGKSAEDAAHFSDVLFHTVKKGKTTIAALGGTFGRVLGIAASVGLGFEEVSAALATLTLSLGSTEMAMTAINGVILGLMKPSEKLIKLIEKTEYGTVDAMIAALGFADSLELIKKTAEDNDVPLKDLFSNMRALMAVLPLLTTQQKQFNDILASYANITDTAVRASDEVMKAFEMSVKRMQKGIENMLRSLGRELIIKLQPKIDAFNDKMETMGELNWVKLAQILTDNWSNILIALGQLVLAGGKFIGTALIDSIVEGIDASIPKLNQKLALLTATMITLMGAMGMPNVIVKGLLKVIEKISDLELTGKNAKTAFEEFKTTISEIVSTLITSLAPAFEKLKTVIDDSLVDLPFATISDKFKNLTFDMRTEAQILGDALKTMWKKVSDPETLNKMQQFVNAIGDIHGNFLGLRKAQIQSELDAQIGAVLASGLAEEEKQAKISNLREVARQKEIAAAKKLKPIKLAQAISNTALGITKAFADPGGIFGFALAALIGIAGAAEVATIAAQPYARGGFVRMGGNIPASDTIPAMLAPNEIVSTAAASERFGAEIQRLNQLAEGGGFGGAKGDTFYINAMDSQSFLDAIQANPAKFADAQRLIKSERF